MSLKTETTVRTTRGAIKVKGERNQSHTLLEVEKRTSTRVHEDEDPVVETETIVLFLRNDEVHDLIRALQLLV